MQEVINGYSIAIPAYGRPKEYEELLMSILAMDKQPEEVIICEDFSNERALIKNITQSNKILFEENKIKLNYIENESNLGYDANIRKLIDLASFKWVILIGNDDLFLKNGLNEIDSFCKKNPSIAMISRPFIRFEKDIEKPLGVSRILPTETIINQKDSPKFIFRACGFVGGLVINKEWAQPLKTNKYDGTLYYQIYLAAHAFCTNGIGYLENPSVGGRAGNPPLFGTTKKDSVHIPGSYTAKGRASMWKGVLDIAAQVGSSYNVNIEDDIRKELMVRQSFHVFEMNVGVSNTELNNLKTELKKIGLFNHWVPKSLYIINSLLGKKAYYFYYLVRKFAQ